MPNFAALSKGWSTLWNLARATTAPPGNGSSRGGWQQPEPAEQLDTSCHPDVVRLHRTLDEIDEHRRTRELLAQKIADRSVVARNRRKELQRRAAEAAPDHLDNPDDTGEFAPAT